MRLQQHVDEGLQRVVLEAEPREVERDPALVENPHDDRLAVHRRHRRHAKVDFLALHAQADATILRQPSLGDVEVRHDLDPRNDRRGQAPRRRFHFVQHAVDAVTDDQPVLERLDVDVRRAHLERVGDQKRHQPDHRGLRREVFQLLDVGVECQFVAAGLHVADELADGRTTRAVQPLERRFEIGGNRDHRPDRASGDHLERADRVGVGRIGHRQPELRFVLAHRQCARFAEEACRDALLEDGKFRVPVRVDHRQRQLRRQRFGNVALGAKSERDEQRAELFAALRLQPQRALQIRRIELAALDQDFAESFSGRCVQRAIRDCR